ncbi:hypothetical protein [Enterobacter hormaechei]|uniref:hypothetical protein n=1 Tax=Enterobacter hormaechei TaxID=158836 RepID=UPI002231528C|nr:hypothetical protein [Enterobacter hormaechei]
MARTLSKERGDDCYYKSCALYRKSYSYKLDIQKDITFYQPFHSPLSMQLPQKLDYGEQATFWIDIDGGSEWIEKIALGLKEQNANPKDFKCVVSVTTGESFTFEIEKSLMDKITSSYQQISEAESR